MTPASVKPGTSDVARHIARVAAHLFATQGYDATSVRAIVEAAGVTKPTLYYHYGSKEGLAQALVIVPMSSLNQELRTILESVSDPVEMLERMFEAHFAWCREDPNRSRFIFALFFGPLANGLMAEMEKFKGGMNCVMTEIVEYAARRGIVDPDRVEAFETACRALIIVSIMDFLYKQRDLGPGLAERLVRDLLGGFRKPGGPARSH
ncbi:TetR/AcrR family transcriptional regulator [Singulisphaera acidiphila]|uniref:Transcriptional regulator n=1 Tax=Singulisphaera acidiphila (strain ATCC BAA-1392 / DSM 18658 / VKM B-2454 / MOB10) TaxID=886293 RepID=L0D7Q6_SINAD|nr:TetR/AcrR family transcriptional regulator [Singulisphaera acidiphila]AGA25424.1 transcriptional regulator [Singulisphaera acidiphila DSM 18658]